MVLNVVVMAAGKGTRMRSARPKVLHTLGGRHLLQHVLGAAAGLGAVAHDRRHRPWCRRGRAERARRRACAFVRQEPQLGTGHALQQAAPLLDDDGTTLVLNGDVPADRGRDPAARSSPPCGGDAAGAAHGRPRRPARLRPHRPRRGQAARDATSRSSRRRTHRPSSARSARSTPASMAAPTRALKRWLAAPAQRQRRGRVLPHRRRRAARWAKASTVVGVAASERDRGARRQQPGAARRPRARATSARRRAPDGGRRAPRRPGTLRPARHAALRQRRRDRRRLHLRRQASSSATACASAPTACSRNARIDGRRHDPSLHAHRRRVARRERRRGRHRRPVRPPARRRRRSAPTSTSATSSRSRTRRWATARRPITSPTSATPTSARASTTAPAASPPTTTARTSTARRSAPTSTSAATACWSRRSWSATARRSAAARRSTRTRRAGELTVARGAPGDGARLEAAGQALSGAARPEAIVKAEGARGSVGRALIAACSARTRRVGRRMPQAAVAARAPTARHRSAHAFAFSAG